MKLFNLILEQNENYQKIIETLQTSTKNIGLSGVFSSSKSHIISSINNSALIICENEVNAKKMFKDLSFFHKDNIFYYPSKDIIFYSADIKSLDIIKDRFKVINEILQKKSFIMITSVESLFDRLVEKEVLQEFILNFKVGDLLNLDELVEKLVFMGYERVENIEVQGQFAVRGGIIDIFTSVMENAFRIELWGDEIDSIRLLDSFSNRSISPIEEVTIYPMRELVYSQNTLDFAIKNIEKELENTVKKYLNNNEIEKAKNLQEKIHIILEKLKNEKTCSGMDKFIQHFYKKTVSLFDYLPEDTIIYFDEPDKIKEQFKIKQREFFESVEGRILKGEVFPSIKDILFSYDEILSFSNKFRNILISNFNTSSFEDFRLKEKFDFNVKNVSILKNSFESLCDEIYYYKKLGYKIVFLAGNRIKCERIQKEFNDKNITSVFLNDEKILESDYKFQEKIVYILRGGLTSGFAYPDEKFVLITDNELFSENKKTRKKHKFKGKKIDSFSDLSVGDYIVHENHGIGIFCGIEKIVSDGISKDYLKLEYQNNASLYVPINQMEVVQKYIAGETNLTPKLNKLGDKRWQKSTSKAKAQIKILAQDLINLYAKRQVSKGFAYSKDNIWQKEFEDSFPYQETDDQLNAISDVKSDMESSRVMDRLICGDVGFGKTEVAIRAIFKAVQDGKQVAFLVPTTILAQQHYNNFKERMKNYPINIEMISRFRTPKQQRQTIEGLEKGFIDILIGTHRILSKDIKFKDLGLIVVDEEQRFGVSHKEKLKSIKENVDVLTLSATPIPRTLHMSMTGIRDMSLLEESPGDRTPVQTYVLEYDEETIKSAINREINRNGQVYYLYNRVTTIEDEANKIQNLLPHINVSFAHGQMSERELEKVMLDFIEHKIDVLVCTTIIETGLDISNVNTIIIQNADTMGLSQLYQLRGRVGRSDKNAVAYLMYKQDKTLKEISEKRLQTIRDFTEFGSGFKIAMRDLEIRGAGNLLGAEQHGHMELIGYEMYCKFLEEAICEIKGEKIKESFETSIDIAINAFIPSDYIKNQVQKLEMYKKISLINDVKDFYNVQDELEDRFGTIPKFVQNLLNIALMKSFAHKAGVISIVQRRDKININFKEDNSINLEKLTNIIKNSKKLSFSGVLAYKISSDVNPVLELKEIFEQIV